MAVSANYVVQVLLQETGSSQHPIIWRERSNGGYGARVRGVRLNINVLSGVTGSYVGLTLKRGLSSTMIVEPQPTGLFHRKYDSTAEADLSQGLRGLLRAVVHQCASRKLADLHNSEAVTEALFQRVLFGPPARPHQRRSEPGSARNGSG